jgi:dolichol-phosphate mannosyltransferase
MEDLNLCEANYLKINDDKIEYIFVDDGSGDRTFEKLMSIKEQNQEKVKVIKLTGNFGSINAIMAGISNGTGDCYVTLSADLQEPANLIFEMFKVWKKGIKLVIAKRRSRKDSLFTIIYSKIFHFLLRTFAMKEAPKGGFDLVLFDKKIRDFLVNIDEKNTNIFYSIFLFKYPYETIEYDRKPRKYGKSKWIFSKKVKLLIDSFVSFSFFPIRLISGMGLFLGIIAFLYGLFIISARIFNLIHLQGWAAIMVVLLFVSSFQMIAIGILGEYIWRSLDASRNRPIYIIDEIY